MISSSPNVNTLSSELQTQVGLIYQKYIDRFIDDKSPLTN